MRLALVLTIALAAAPKAHFDPDPKTIDADPKTWPDLYYRQVEETRRHTWKLAQAYCALVVTCDAGLGALEEHSDGGLECFCNRWHTWRTLRFGADGGAVPGPLESGWQPY